MEFILFAVTGSFAGILAGLLGIGGGIVVVPCLVIIFSDYGFHPDVVMHMAAATSLAAMIFTASFSAYSHHRRGAVRWEVFKKLLPGIIVGTLSGALLASVITAHILQIVFALFLLIIAMRMFFLRKPENGRHFPRPFTTHGVALVIGTKSGLLGIGGGAILVPFFTWCNMSMREASGTSAACGLPIAITGTLSTMLTGWYVAGLSGGAFGYVYWPAALTVAAASVLSVFLGAKLSLWLPVRVIKRVFALVLVVAAVNLLQ